MSTTDVFRPNTPTSEPAYVRALRRVAQMVGQKMDSELDEVKLQQKGVSFTVVEVMIKDTGLASELDWIIKPRTLNHRKAKGQELLTSQETGRWLRASKVILLAEEVFGNSDKAKAWLHKSRKSFDGQTAMNIMSTEAGAQMVEDALNQIDSGYFA